MAIVKASKIFRQNKQAYNDGVRLIANKGGTRSGKTWSILLLLICIAIEAKERLLISIVSSTFPHLKRGAMRDFELLLGMLGLADCIDYKRNLSDSTFRFGNCVIEFFGCEQAAKVHGPQRDILFVNEANNIPYEVYRQLAIRTARTIFIDFNPTTRFWYDDKLSMLPDSRMIHSTYLDNPFLSEKQVKEIETYKNDASWWRVYGLGLTGMIGGLVYTNWEVIQDSDMPKYEDCKMHSLGLDFGFTNDPTALLDVRLAHDEIYIDEVCYDRGMTNPDIAEVVRKNGLAGEIIIADSAEPKSIAELCNMHLRVEEAQKGKDSIRLGISIVSRYKLKVTARSIGITNELKNYKYKQDKDGNLLNETIDYFNHSLDALRYVALNRLNKRRNGIQMYGI